jgi:hypothetical protein
MGASAGMGRMVEGEDSAPSESQGSYSCGTDMGMGIDVGLGVGLLAEDFPLDLDAHSSQSLSWEGRQQEQVQEFERLQSAHLQMQEHMALAATQEPFQPLVPGLYNLVPKKWLQAWRRYTKDLTQNSLPHLDCATFLCHSHGLLVVPPHVEEYLVGLRRGLTSGLGLYEGQVAEIVTAEEWDELQGVFRSADFNVRFCLDGNSTSWSIGLCTRCNPLNYNAEHSSVPTRNQQSQGLQV